MRKLSTFLIVMGILVIAYPLLDRTYSWYMQRQIEETYANLDQVFLGEEENIGTPASVPETTVSDPTVTVPIETATQATTEATTQPTTQPAEPKAVPKPIGVIKISKISVKLPILSGATAANMKIGAGWMKQTTPIGQNGNTAIAAHRSYTKGRMFNRLNEMVIGDTFQIIAEGKEYNYKVYNIVVVEPTDTSVLKGNTGESIVTLITCTPIKVATHRLIVQGKLVK